MIFRQFPTLILVKLALLTGASLSFIGFPTPAAAGASRYLPHTTDEWGLMILEPPYAQWVFAPEDQAEEFPVTFGRGLSHTVPWRKKCCSGEYIGHINTNFYAQGRDLNESQVGILFPPIGGEIIELDINGRSLKLSKKDYSVSGPYITLLKNEVRSGHLEIRLKLKSKRDFHSGMWMGKPILGRMNDLVDHHEEHFIRNSIIPIGYAITCCVIGIFFLLVLLASNSREAFYLEFIFVLLSWSIFYVFLSGQMRLWFPFLSRFLYFPSRTLASLCTIRLIARFANADQGSLRKMTQAGFILIILQIIAKILDLGWIQEVSVPLLLFPMATYLVALIERSHSWMKKTIFAVGCLDFLCFFSDSTKNYSNVLNFSYPLPYLNRHMAIVLIFTSLMYVILHVARDVTSRVRSETFEEAASQFVHDVQSPVAALRLAVHAIEQGTQDAPVIISSAIRRITDIVQSLRIFLKEKHLPKVQSLKQMIDAVVKEKDFQFQLENRFRLEVHYDEQAQSACVKVQSVEMERLLSNLINNATESMENGGTVRVQVSTQDDDSIIEVADQGKGIAPIVLRRIGTRGITFGKPHGSGLGLYHAKKAIQSWGGQFKITSIEGEGTRVKISLPLGRV